jgi:hypothetical protein
MMCWILSMRLDYGWILRRGFFESNHDGSEQRFAMRHSPRVTATMSDFRWQWPVFCLCVVYAVGGGNESSRVHVLT